MGINRASRSKRFGILFTAALSLLSLATPATAQYLTFVSATGNDANNCLVQASPCKTLQKAINVTAANGEVRLLSRLISNGYINKSITIDGAGNTLIGQIVINSASAVVTLRGLSLNGIRAFANGIRIDSAAEVHIEDCTVERYTNDGIKLVATTATRLFVSDTVASFNGSDGLYADDLNAGADIENSRFEGNASTGLYLKVAKATVLQSVASGNVSSGIILRTPNAKVAETTANDNGNIGLYSDLVSAKVEIDNSRFEGNGNSGLSLQVAYANVTRSIASANAAVGIILLSGRNRITESIADDNGGDGFSVRAGTVYTVLDAAAANGNGGDGLDIAATVTALITHCVFIHGGGAAVANYGTLRSTLNNYFSNRTGNALTEVPEG
jgi:hypothetical protein